MKLNLHLALVQNHIMKINLKFLLLFFTILFVCKIGYGQKEISSYEDLKAWKLTYILENTSMNPKELEIYKCIFEDYENNYHKEIWSKKHRIHETYGGKNKKMLFDSISSSEAKNLIYDFDSYEILGMKMKHQRNEKLLKKIRPKIVLSILYQEKNFDRKLFNKIKTGSRNKKRK